MHWKKHEQRKRAPRNKAIFEERQTFVARWAAIGEHSPFLKFRNTMRQRGHTRRSGNGLITKSRRSAAKPAHSAVMRRTLNGRLAETVIKQLISHRDPTRERGIIRRTKSAIRKYTFGPQRRRLMHVLRIDIFNLHRRPK